MTPDRELQAQIDRAEHAHRLLNDQLLQDALAAIRADLVQQWVDCPVRDEKGKEICWQLMKTATMFENLLRGHIETGKLAQVNLKAFDGRNRLQKAWGFMANG
jgi:hypothetical protein